MKYVALLRGINVGGNNAVNMKELARMLEKMGYADVLTYINSGNVVFEAPDKPHNQLRLLIERELDKTFSLPLRIVLRDKTEIETILKHVPKKWHTETDIRCYVAFVREPVTTSEVIAEMQPKEGVDEIDEAPNAVFITTKSQFLTKSGLNKIASKKMYKEITIRNFNTLKKIASLMGIENAL